MDRSVKISIIGAGSVGSAIANALVYGEACGRLVLHDIDVPRAEAEAWDIADGTPLSSAVRVTPAPSLDGIHDSDVVILTAGAKRRGAESRLQLLDRNAELIATLMPQLDEAAPSAVVIVVTNPVDVITRLAIECSARPPGSILGSGTLLDSSRLRVALAKAYDVSPASIDAIVIGEHGDSSVAAWSSATIGSVRLDDLPIPAGRSLAEMKQDALKAVRQRGYAIHAGKGYTNYGIAAAIARIVGAVVSDERAVLPVSVRAIEPYDIGSDVVLSLPSVIGREGVVQTIMIALDPEEREALAYSAHVLEEAYANRNTPALSS